jgi:hypothetical protein
MIMSEKGFGNLYEFVRDDMNREDVPVDQERNVPDVETEGVDAAVERLREWVGEEVDDAQIRRVLWGIAMERKNSDVVDKAIDAIYAEHRGEMEDLDSDEPMEGRNPSDHAPEGKKIKDLMEEDYDEGTTEAPVRTRPTTPTRKRKPKKHPLRPEPGQSPEPKGKQGFDVELFKKRRMGEG